MTKKVLPVTAPRTIDFGNGQQLTTAVHPDTMMHSVQCDLCGTIVQLTVTGAPEVIRKHRGGKGCARAQRNRFKRLCYMFSLQCRNTVA